MKVLIIEDEKIAQERLIILLKQYDENTEILSCIDSVEDAVEWLNANEHPDVLLLDIQLADGYSFDIFKQVVFDKPIIFTTAFSNYTLDAFKYFSIDYLIKPISYESLKAALDKYRRIAMPAPRLDYENLSRMLQQITATEYKDRFLGRVGQKLSFIKAAEIMYFMADDKLVFMVDINGGRSLVDYTLEKLEEIIDPKIFFRINRRTIISVESIGHIKPYINNRLQVFMKNEKNQEEHIVSRERVQAFRKWAGY